MEKKACRHPKKRRSREEVGPGVYRETCLDCGATRRGFTKFYWSRFVAPRLRVRKND